MNNDRFLYCLDGDEECYPDPEDLLERLWDAGWDDTSKVVVIEERHALPFSSQMPRADQVLEMIEERLYDPGSPWDLEETIAAAFKKADRESLQTILDQIASKVNWQFAGKKTGESSWRWDGKVWKKVWKEVNLDES